jgi:hypothetical protein
MGCLGDGKQPAMGGELPLAGQGPLSSPRRCAVRGPGLADGDRFAGRYRIRSHLGDGGMGAVFLADDELLGEGVALKVAARAGADHASDDDADNASRQRQRREVSLARRVTHPNVARVFDLGVDDGRLDITMEHVLGTSLCGRLRSGPLPIDDVASIGHQVASALAAAHDAGVVHLDLKPDNVVVVDGVGGLLAPDFVAQTLSGHDVSGDPLLLRFHLAFWLFGVGYGVGYGVAAHRLSQASTKSPSWWPAVWARWPLPRSGSRCSCTGSPRRWCWLPSRSTAASACSS